MELVHKVHQERAQPSPEELISFCDVRMQWACRMYPVPLRPTLETQAEYTAEWLEIADVIGKEKFSEGLVKAVRESEYFPTIKKLRDCCGVSEEKQQKAGADAAWLYVREHVRKYSSIYEPEAARLLPPRIAHATRLVGGLSAIEYCPDASLPFMKKDFCAAWEQYQESSAALNALMLAAPLSQKLLGRALDKKIDKPIAEKAPSPAIEKPALCEFAPTDEELELLKIKAAQVAAKIL